MINALFSYKSGGSKQFKHGAQLCTFGWDTIIAMYQREVSRARQQLTRMLPRLKEVHWLLDKVQKLLSLSEKNFTSFTTVKPSESRARNDQKAVAVKPKVKQVP